MDIIAVLKNARTQIETLGNAEDEVNRAHIQEINDAIALLERRRSEEPFDVTQRRNKFKTDNDLDVIVTVAEYKEVLDEIENLQMRLGAEAEALRAGVEKLIKDISDGALKTKLQGLLDRVEAGDCLAYLGKIDGLKKRVDVLEKMFVERRHMLGALMSSIIAGGIESRGSNSDSFVIDRAKKVANGLLEGFGL